MQKVYWAVAILAVTTTAALASTAAYAMSCCP
jgi:hypothetical protein